MDSVALPNSSELVRAKRAGRALIRAHASRVSGPAFGTASKRAADYRFLAALCGPGPVARQIACAPGAELVGGNAGRAPLDFSGYELRAALRK